MDVVPDSTKAYVTVLGKQLEILGSKKKGGCQGVEWVGHVNLPEGRCGGLEVTKEEELILHSGQYGQVQLDWTNIDSSSINWVEGRQNIYSNLLKNGHLI